MKIRRRIMHQFLCLLICFSFLFSAKSLQAATTGQQHAGKQLRVLGILTGYEDGSLGLDQSVTRAEMATILVRTLGLKVDQDAEKNKDFQDVKDGYWAKNFIQAAATGGLVSGYKDGTYKPLNNITFNEMITMLIRSHGTSPKNGVKWPQSYTDPAKSIGLIQEEVDGAKRVTRGEVAFYLWRTLLIKK